MKASDIDPKAISLDDLELSTRAYNALKNAGAETAADVIRFTSAELLRKPNLGRRTRNEIRSALGSFGLALRGEEATSDRPQAWADLQQRKAAEREMVRLMGLLANARKEVARLERLIEHEQRRMFGLPVDNARSDADDRL